MINNHALVGQSLRCRWVDRTLGDCPDEGRLVVRFSAAKACKKLVIKNAVQGRRIVLNFSSYPFLAKGQHLLLSVGWRRNARVLWLCC
jgi:hypothetical protein